MTSQAFLVVFLAFSFSAAAVFVQEEGFIDADYDYQNDYPNQAIDQDLDLAAKFLTGGHETLISENVIGRVVCGPDATNEVLTSSQGRHIIMVTSGIGLQRVMDAAGSEGVGKVLQRIGFPADLVASIVATYAASPCKLVVWKKTPEVVTATWENAFQMTKDVYDTKCGNCGSEIKNFTDKMVKLYNHTFDKASGPGRLFDDLLGSNSSEKLMAEDLKKDGAITLKKVRQFFATVLSFNRLYTGNGKIYNEDTGDNTIPEFIMPNKKFDELKPRLVLQIPKDAGSTWTAWDSINGSKDNHGHTLKYFS